MNFIEATKWMFKGKHIRLPYWHEGDFLFMTTRGRLIHNDDGDYEVNGSDITSDDWEVL